MNFEFRKKIAIRLTADCRNHVNSFLDCIMRLWQISLYYGQSHQITIRLIIWLFATIVLKFGGTRCRGDAIDWLNSANRICSPYHYCLCRWFRSGCRWTEQSPPAGTPFGRWGRSPPATDAPMLILSGNGCGVPLHDRSDHDCQAHDPLGDRDRVRVFLSSSILL